MKSALSVHKRVVIQYYINLQKGQKGRRRCFEGCIRELWDNLLSLIALCTGNVILADSICHSCSRLHGLFSFLPQCNQDRTSHGRRDAFCERHRRILQMEPFYSRYVFRFVIRVMSSMSEIKTGFLPSRVTWNVTEGQMKYVYVNSYQPID